jgi:hypothetical protein
MSAFECCGQTMSIIRLHLTKIAKNGDCVDRNEFAFLNIAIGECRIDAELLRDGSLRLPRGVRIPEHLQQRATEEARQMAIAELIDVWDQQRDTGEI